MVLSKYYIPQPLGLEYIYSSSVFQVIARWRFEEIHNTALVISK